MKYYQIRVSGDLITELRAVAKENERSLSAQIRCFIVNYPRGIAKARKITVDSEPEVKQKRKCCRARFSDEMIKEIKESAWKNERSVTSEMNYIIKCGLRGVE